jgi:arylsulfatase
VKPGSVANDIVSGLDWFPTLLAAAGDASTKDRLAVGTDAAGKRFNVHLDGHNQLPYLTGHRPESARNEFFYFNDDGDLGGMRYENWKFVVMEQRAAGTLQVWAEPFTPLRVPKLFDLRADPYERADVTSNTYWDWVMNKEGIAIATMAIVGPFLETFREFPPSQRPASFTIGQAMDKLKHGLGGK